MKKIMSIMSSLSFIDAVCIIAIILILPIFIISVRWDIKNTKAEKVCFVAIQQNMHENPSFVGQLLNHFKYTGKNFINSSSLEEDIFAGYISKTTGDKCHALYPSEINRISLNVYQDYVVSTGVESLFRVNRNNINTISPDTTKIKH